MEDFVLDKMQFLKLQAIYNCLFLERDKQVGDIMHRCFKYIRTLPDHQKYTPAKYIVYKVSDTLEERFKVRWADNMLEYVGYVSTADNILPKFKITHPFFTIDEECFNRFNWEYTNLFYYHNSTIDEIMTPIYQMCEEKWGASKFKKIQNVMYAPNDVICDIWEVNHSQKTFKYLGKYVK
jgi:hypothetical protein